MLSFLGKIRTRKMMNRMKTIINKLTKSLQVPCSPLFYISKSYLPGKRVLPFISQKRTRKRFEGSITVEAAVVLPLFVFFGLAVLAPMRWLDTQRQIQTTMDRLVNRHILWNLRMSRRIFSWSFSIRKRYHSSLKKLE